MRASRECHQCGNTLRRVQRTFWEKLLYGSAYQCHDCGARVYEPNLLWIDMRSYASCPSCGTWKITLRSKPDPIEKVYSSPSNFIKRIFGNKLYRCRYCRLQFHEFRNIRKSDAEPETGPIQVRG
jgi:predicted RNA-binding Zn-ribbon protein involved in translation (DUF1610 family)